MHDLVVWVQEVAVPWLGPGGIFLACLLDSSFLSLPEISDLLVIAWSSKSPETAWAPVLLATLGSLTGCVLLWGLSKRGGEPLLRRRFGTLRVERTRAAFKRWDVLALALPAVLPPPMPFKVFVLSAGAFGIPLRRFAVTLAAARGVRYVFWASIGIYYGQEARAILAAFDAWAGARSHWLMAVALAGILGVVGFYYLQQRRRREAPEA